MDEQGTAFSGTRVAIIPQGGHHPQGESATRIMGVAASCGFRTRLTTTSCVPDLITTVNGRTIAAMILQDALHAGETQLVDRLQAMQRTFKNSILCAPTTLANHPTVLDSICRERGSEVTFVTPSEDPIRRTLELATALAVGLQDAAAAARAQEPALTAQAQQAIEEGAATLAGQRLAALKTVDALHACMQAIPVSPPLEPQQVSALCCFGSLQGVMHADAQAVAECSHMSSSQALQVAGFWHAV